MHYLDLSDFRDVSFKSRLFIPCPYLYITDVCVSHPGAVTKGGCACLKRAEDDGTPLSIPWTPTRTFAGVQERRKRGVVPSCLPHFLPSTPALIGNLGGRVYLHG